MNPKISLGGTQVRRTKDAVVVVREDDERTLTPIAGRLVDLADGTRDAAELLEQIGCSKEQLWSAFDELADAGLMSSRVTPPAGDVASWGAPTSRRRVLKQVGLAAGVIAGTGLVGASRAATGDAQQEAKLKQQEQNLKQDAEQDQKQQEERQKHDQEKDAKELHHKKDQEEKHKVHDKQQQEHHAKEASSKEEKAKEHEQQHQEHEHKEHASKEEKVKGG